MSSPPTSPTLRPLSPPPAASPPPSAFPSRTNNAQPQQQQQEQKAFPRLSASPRSLQARISGRVKVGEGVFDRHYVRVWCFFHDNLILFVQKRNTNWPLSGMASPIRLSVVIVSFMRFNSSCSSRSRSKAVPMIRHSGRFPLCRARSSLGDRRSTASPIYDKGNWTSTSRYASIGTVTLIYHTIILTLFSFVGSRSIGDQDIAQSDGPRIPSSE